MEAEAEHPINPERGGPYFKVIPDSMFPDGRNVVLMEVDGITVWFLREGQPVEALLPELNLYADYLVRLGLWIPNMGDRKNPPAALRKAG